MFFVLCLCSKGCWMFLLFHRNKLKGRAHSTPLDSDSVLIVSLLLFWWWRWMKLIPQPTLGAFPPVQSHTQSWNVFIELHDKGWTHAYDQVVFFFSLCVPFTQNKRAGFVRETHTQSVEQWLLCRLQPQLGISAMWGGGQWRNLCLLLCFSFLSNPLNHQNWLGTQRLFTQLSSRKRLDGQCTITNVFCQSILPLLIPFGRPRELWETEISPLVSFALHFYCTMEKSAKVGLGVRYFSFSLTYTFFTTINVEHSLLSFFFSLVLNLTGNWTVSLVHCFSVPVTWQKLFQSFLKISVLEQIDEGVDSAVEKQDKQSEVKVDAAEINRITQIIHKIQNFIWRPANCKATSHCQQRDQSVPSGYLKLILICLGTILSFWHIIPW